MITENSPKIDLSNKMPDNPSYGRKRKILIVEDEFVNREILASYLNVEYDVVCAETGAEALKIISEQTECLDLILLDLILPDMHGLDILTRIKKHERASRIPVIVVTSDKESEVESLNIGAADFITKPYPAPKIVQARVKRIIELSEDRDIIHETEWDNLTGLYTREFFFSYALHYDVYHSDEPMDALMLNVNHFRMINERFGKAYADEVLARIGQAILSIMREAGGFACRGEADIFMVYCPHFTDYAGFLGKIVSAACGSEKGRIRVRMGVYENVDKSIEPERRFDRAKIAADTIRNSYTTFIALYDNKLHESELYAEKLLDEFQDALEHKQFTIYFQPKFDIRPETPLLCGAEALVRWIHPELGIISPGVFIPLFEKNGLIEKLDYYVWRNAAAHMGEWKRRHGFSIPISVNVSRIDILDPELPYNLKKIVDECGIETTDLHLEITESAYTEDAHQIALTVDKLREFGFVIEMDDFGSGYSSLGMISTLPIDILKLDMMFIRNLFKEKGNMRMLRIVVDISDLLSVPMVAEGVETKEQLFALRTMGCEIVQGYYFAKPMPSDEFEKYLLEHRDIVKA